MFQGLHRRGRSRPRSSDTHAESGQALLELALVTPVLVLLIVAIFQFAVVIQSQVGLTNALREAARRVAATEPTAPPNWSTLAAWVQGELCGDAAAPCEGGLLEENVQSFDGARLWVDPPPVMFCSYVIDFGGTPETQYRVQASVTYKHPVFFGILAFATDLVDGTPNGFWDLSASAQMRLENVDDTDPLFVAPAACP